MVGIGSPGIREPGYNLLRTAEISKTAQPKCPQNVSQTANYYEECIYEKVYARNIWVVACVYARTLQLRRRV